MTFALGCFWHSWMPWREPGALQHYERAFVHWSLRGFRSKHSSASSGRLFKTLMWILEMFTHCTVCHVENMKK